MGEETETTTLYRAFIHLENRTFQKQGELLNLGESFILEIRTQAQPHYIFKLEQKRKNTAKKGRCFS